MPIRSYVRSTDLNRVSHGKNILGSVDVSVMVRPTVGAIPFPHIQRQSLKNVTTVATAFIVISNENETLCLL
jgi:hypothetical protein